METTASPLSTIMDLQEAKELFFQYDGSRFYMSRDHVESTYLAAGVPPDVEAAWLGELTSNKLPSLSRRRNWRVLHFLNHHADVGCLDEVVQAEPKGALWERCAFLEQIVAYTRRAREAGCDPTMISRAARKAAVEAERLSAKSRSMGSTRRLRSVLTEARRLLGEIETD